MFDDGLIYRGERLINWCPRCHTALSDLEVEHDEAQGSLWYIRYPVVDGTDADGKPNETGESHHRRDDASGDLSSATPASPSIRRTIATKR